LNVSLKCLEALHAISLLSLECKTPHHVFEELVISYAIEIAPAMFNNKVASQIKAILCSEDAVQNCRNVSRCG
jgi:hypothetical protein